MRTPRHDYGRKNGGWWAEHGAAVWIPSPYGPLVKIDGYAPLQSELLLAAKGLLEVDQAKWQTWRMGDPKLPDPSFGSILQDLPILTMDALMPRLRGLDADWDVHDAERSKRRYGPE